MSLSNTRARKMVALGLLATWAIVPAACSRKESNTSREETPVLSGPPKTAYPMPPFKADAPTAGLGWTLHDGQPVRLADYHGKVLVLDFYATWCAPCRESIPHLIELQRRSGSQDLQVVGLNVGGPDDRVKVAAFASEFNIQYPLGFPDKSLTDLFLSVDDSIPQTLVFNRKGQLVKSFIGYDSSMPKQLEQAIQTALISSSN